MESVSSKKLLKAETLISYVLRYGVIICGALIAVGLFARLFHLGPIPISSHAVIQTLLSGKELADYGKPASPGDFFSALLAFQPDTVIAFGLVLLIALPVVRVGMTVFLFLIEKDWLYLCITLLVFTVLISSLVLGKSL